MTSRFRKTPEEIAALEPRIVADWDGGDMTQLAIARKYHVGADVVRRMVQKAFAEGRTTRDPNPPSSRASRTGRP